MLKETEILKLSSSNLSPDKIIVKNSGLVFLQRVEDPDGDLIIAEKGKDLPPEFFTRIYRRDVVNPASISGYHAHKTTEQYIFSAAGSFVLHLDDGERKQDVLMDAHHIGVKLGRRLWHTMSNFEMNSVLLVYANSFYSEEDYIRGDYGQFLEYIKSNP